MTFGLTVTFGFATVFGNRVSLGNLIQYLLVGSRVFAYIRSYLTSARF